MAGLRLSRRCRLFLPCEAGEGDHAKRGGGGGLARLRRFALAILLASLPFPALADPPASIPRPVTVGRICYLIEVHAYLNGLPPDFFARLIWKESRFDANAVSPAGAEGIAQFMPGTAQMRGLKDSFDVERAIPASAKYLGELKTGFGNLGLAAAAYNSGENRVTRWISSGGLLPIETENYVFDIMGEPADRFSDAAYAGTIQPLDPKDSFARACRRMPAIESTMVAMATVHAKPWGVQVAGSFRRSAAVKRWSLVQSRFGSLFAGSEVAVSRVRSPRGRTGIYVVRVGMDSQQQAAQACQKLRSAGGSCIVKRNR